MAGNCLCAICSINLDFNFDNHLLEEIERHNCIIFAGAGISTESKLVFPDSFYDQIKALVETDDNLPFPELMQLFEKQPNGRQKLISQIINRFDYINSFRSMREIATEFHNELSTMPYFSRVITTNWDNFFEECAGFTPFVYESDIPFWELADRGVLKIHGSIDNYASIVATTDDYTACLQRLRDGAVGAVLKQIFATKTCIFVGYSATDSDFLTIYETILHGLGAFSRTHYIVSPYITKEDSLRLGSLNILPIETSGSHFLRTVKSHMIEKFCFAKDESYFPILQTMMSLVEEHIEFTNSIDMQLEPHLLCSAWYQDGLIHSLQRILDLKKTGKYSNLHFVQDKLRSYDEKVSGFIKRKNYAEASYFTGYMNGFIFFLICNKLADGNDVRSVPFYFHPGMGEFEDVDEYNEIVRRNPKVHKASLAQCTRIVAKKGAGASMVLQHQPWG